VVIAADAAELPARFAKIVVTMSKGRVSRCHDLRWRIIAFGCALWGGRREPLFNWEDTRRRSGTGGSKLTQLPDARNEADADTILITAHLLSGFDAEVVPDVGHCSSHNGPRRAQSGESDGPTEEWPPRLTKGRRRTDPPREGEGKEDRERRKKFI